MRREELPAPFFHQRRSRAAPCRPGAVVPDAVPVVLPALKLLWETLVAAELVTGFGMSRTLWIAAAVDLAAAAAILAAPSVRHLQRPGKPQPGHSAQQAVAG